jgi:hypothetical protein
MTATEPSDRTRTERPGWFLFLVLVSGGTVAWAVRFALGYLLVPTACEVGDWVLHLVTVVTALAALLVLVLSLRWADRTDDTAVGFTLLVGAALDAFFLGAILLEGSGVLVVDACMKGAIP